MSSQEQQSNTRASEIPTDPAARIPLELWELMLEDIPPSQLTVLAQVSRTFTQVVRNLSVWRVIWNKAQLDTRETNGLHSSVYGAVLAFSEHICEGCYGYDQSRFPISYDSEWRGQIKPNELLKVSRFIDTRALCLTCELYREYLQEQRREDLGHRLSIILGGKGYDTELLSITKLPYILSGHQDDIQTTVDFISREPVHRELEKALPPTIRRSKLESKLQERGLQLRADSRLCNKYIQTGDVKPVDKIVEIMAELDWLHRETRYGALCRGRTNPICIFLDRRASTFPMKKKALEEYIRYRFENDQWSHVRDDPDTPKRPPRSLWDLIEDLEPDICVEYVTHCISYAPSTSTDNIRMLSDEDLIQRMDEGEKIVKKSSMSTSSSSSLRLSENLKNFLGTSTFHFLLNRCRAESIFNKEQDLKVERHTYQR